MNPSGSWQGTLVDSMSTSTASFDSMSELGSSQLSEERFDVGKLRRAWSTNKFAQRIVISATTSGDDKALADILNAFPEMCTADANLWLRYMKEEISLRQTVDDCIMRLFPVVKWQDVLTDADSRRLFPEIDRLMPQEAVGAEQVGLARGQPALRPGNQEQSGQTQPTAEPFAAVPGDMHGTETGCDQANERPAPDRLQLPVADQGQRGALISPQDLQLARSLCETLRGHGPINIVIGDVVVHSMRL
ncbi:hypothetical protein AURDEDRAFT_166639 [Auricularia subglabra TFB-10046 SS5]|nr:hypothetical protein AURDEDRAFT_166639 [Auricularia subglabra TFB-10046 SS5]